MGKLRENSIAVVKGGAVDAANNSALLKKKKPEKPRHIAHDAFTRQFLAIPDTSEVALGGVAVREPMASSLHHRNKVVASTDSLSLSVDTNLKSTDSLIGGNR